MKPGMHVGTRYRLDRRVGSGPTGVVWRAVDEMLERDVCVKVLHEQFADDPVLRRHFRDNALSVATIQHPGIGQLFDSNDETLPDGSTITYVVTEHLTARPLSSMVSRRPLDPHLVLPIVAAAAQAVHAAHETGVLHGNLKPQNILVADDGAVVVVDFGSVPGSVGPLSYQSPEQRQAMPLTPASDVYSLGAIAFECFTGQAPGPDGARLALLPDDLSSAVVALLSRCLDPEPTKRFETAELLASECVQVDYASAVLGSLLSPGASAHDEPDTIQPVMVTVPRNAAPDESEPEDAQKRFMPSRGLLLAGVAAVSLGLIATVVAVWPWTFMTTSGDGDGITSESVDAASEPGDDPSGATTPGASDESGSPTPKPLESASPTPEFVIVPDVLGMDRRSARNALVDLDFGVTVTLSGYGDRECPVHAQDPDPYTSASWQAMVTIDVLLVDDVDDCGSAENPVEPSPSMPTSSPSDSPSTPPSDDPSETPDASPTPDPLAMDRRTTIVAM